MATATHNPTSHVTINGSFSSEPVLPAPFVPNDANLWPKWPGQLDKDAWEEWQVQGIAGDGSAAVVVIFFRHRLNAPAGFRVGIIASWAGDGKDEKEQVWRSYAALPHSVITTDAASGNFRGIWRGDEECGPPSVSFEVAADLSCAVFTFNVPDKVVGTITVTSAGYDSTPRTEADGRFTPAFWWLRPIPHGSASADLTFLPLDQATKERGSFPRNLCLGEEHGAFGAVERGWTSLPLPTIISHNWWLWARAGPYVIHVIWIRGRPEAQSPLWGSGRLYRDGQLVSSPQRAIGVEDAYSESEDDALTLEYLHDDSGGITGAFDLNNVGHLIIFRSGGQTWEFRSRHVRHWYDMPSSPPGPNATGLSGFVLSVSGGLLAGSAKSADQFEGPGVAGGGTLA